MSEVRKLTGEEAKAVILVNELLSLDVLTPLLSDALKQWTLHVLQVDMVPSWVIGEQGEIEA